MKNLVTILISCIILLIACEKEEVVKDNVPDPVTDPVTPEDVRVIADMSSDFGWKLFQELAAGETARNVLISPLSVQTALSMAVNGAAGETRSEMLSVLGCNACDVKELNMQTSQLRVFMEEQAGHPRLASANGFFYDDNRIQVLETFIQTLSDEYRAGFETHDFGDPATVDKINAWVKENTGDKIDGIIDEIGSLDLAFLINALHFKADWARTFSVISNPTWFTKFDGNEVPAQYVSNTRQFSTSNQQYFRMADVPFKDSTYSLSFIQPNISIATKPNWILQLTADDLKEMWTNLAYNWATVTFPKLDLEYKEELNDKLIHMGITKAFSGSEADFSEMGNSIIGDRIYISKFHHKAVLKVDENGAEGAAVTAIGFGANSVLPTFKYDRPFVIVLRHTASNAILFAGLVNDPS